MSSSLHRPRLALLGLGGLFAVNGLLSAGIAPRYAEISTNLDLTPAGLGLALGAGTVGAALCAVGLALGLARRLSRRWLALALLAYAVSPLPLALSTSAGGLLVSRVVEGVSNPALDVGQIAMAATLSVALGRTLLPRMEILFTVAALVGAYLAGATIGHLPLRVYLTALGVLALGTVLLAIPHLPQLPPAAEPDQSGRGRLRPPPILLGYLAVLALMVETLPMDWGALYMLTLGASESLAGLGVIAVQTGMVAGLTVTNRLIARMGPIAVLRLAVPVAIAGTAALLAAPSPTPAIYALFLIGVGSGPLLPMVLSLVDDLPTIARLTAVIYLGPLLSRGLGLLGDAVGLWWVIFALIPALGLLLMQVYLPVISQGRR